VWRCWCWTVLQDFLGQLHHLTLSYAWFLGWRTWKCESCRKVYQFGHFGYATPRGDKEVGNALERSAILHRYKTREMENISRGPTFGDFSHYPRRGVHAGHYDCKTME
jgi:hypothetical protein